MLLQRVGTTQGFWPICREWRPKNIPKEVLVFTVPTRLQPVGLAYYARHLERPSLWSPWHESHGTPASTGKKRAQGRQGESSVPRCFSACGMALRLPLDRVSPVATSVNWLGTPPASAKPRTRGPCRHWAPCYSPRAPSWYCLCLTQTLGVWETSQPWALGHQGVLAHGGALMLTSTIAGRAS